MSDEKPGLGLQAAGLAGLRLVGAGRAGGLRDGSAVFDVESGICGRLVNVAVAWNEVPGLSGKAPWLSGHGLVVPREARGEIGAGVLEETRCADSAIYRGFGPGINGE